MKSKHEHGYFIDPANPLQPVHMRIVWGEHRGWRRISRREAAALLGGAVPATLPETPEEQMPETPEPQPPVSLAETVASLHQQPVSEQERFPSERPASVPAHVSFVFDLPPAVAPSAPNIRDQERRAAAKGRLRDAVLRAGQTVPNEQMRYELALQAINGNVEVMVGFEPEARIRRLSVAELAHQIITDRRTAERRMLHAYAVLARISALIDQAAGPAIDDAADAGIREIRALED